MDDIVKDRIESESEHQADISDPNVEILEGCPMHKPTLSAAGKTADSPSAGTAKLPIRDEATSQHLGGTVELTVVADLKPGLINVRETVTYATRLRMLLRTLNALRKARTEGAEDSIFPGPIEHLQTIHHVGWTLFDNDQKMLMSVVFDQALEPYIRKLVDKGGPVLNAILCHCNDYDGYKGYAAFTDFVRKHQVPVEILAASVTGLSVDDKRYLKELEQRQRAEVCPNARDLAAARLQVKAPQDTSTDLSPEIKLRSAKQALQTIAFMRRLDALFPAPDTLPQNDGSVASAKELSAASEAQQRERCFFHTLVKSMLPRFEASWIPNPHPLRQRFASELAWYEEIGCAKCEPAPKQESSWDLESAWAPPEKIQGNILSEYEKITHGCLLLLRLGSPASARSFLDSLRSRVTTAADQGDTTLNIAITYNGLKTLGLSDADLVKFPKEFREGMQARASLLGDVGANHPSEWNLPRANWPPENAAAGGSVALSTVDLVIQLQKANVEPGADKWDWSAEHPLYQQVADLAEEAEQKGGQLLAVEPLRRKLIDGNVHEHFGFRDGLSQPKPGAAASDSNRVALGEVLLGHANDHNDNVTEQRDPLFLNSTFMVLRKLSQDVATFKQFLDGHGNEKEREELAAKMVGRKVDGTPLSLDTPEPYDFKNNFDYAQDSEGSKCPFHAHIRRTNPRDGRQKGEPVPRIMRRGIAYGPRYAEDPDADRGLMFMAYNANIAQQFEVIQRWISGGNSTGVLSAHSDPLLGVPTPGQERTMSIVHDNKVVRYNLGDKPFVKLEWGMYMFVPSIDALQKLCEDDVNAKPYPQANVQRGAKLLEKFKSLDSIESETDARLRWKKLLEDRSARRYAEDAWAAIRAKGGALSTPYGVLVADEKLVMEIMRDQGEVYSVREFTPRMEQATGLLYLGIDPEPRALDLDAKAKQPTALQCPHRSNSDYVSAMQPVEPDGESRYQHESKTINPWIADFCPQQAFEQARERTENWLDKQLLGEGPQQGEIKLKELVRDVLGQLAAQWFGLPNDDSVQIGGAPGTKPHCPEDLQMVASYVFYPNPTPFVEAKARERGQAMRAAIEKYVTTAIEQQTLPANTLLSKLHAEGVEASDLARSIGGVAVGFVSPTTGSLLGALYTWITSEDFWRHQQAYLNQTSQTDDAYSHASAILKSPLIRAMQERPAPPLPHRTAVQEVSLGGVDVKPGQRVVLGVVSAALQQLEKQAGNDEDATRLLFGGNYDERYGERADQATAHACPGQSMAFGAMLGIITRLFELDGTLRATGGLTLSLNE